MVHIIKANLKNCAIYCQKNLKKISPLDLKIKAPKETSKTFKGNSILKAKYFFKRTRLACISDDSGLEVVALKNKPGIYSARWAKKLGSFNFAMKRILNLLKTKKNRNAYFVCSLTLINEKGKIFNSTYRLQEKYLIKYLGKMVLVMTQFSFPRATKKHSDKQQKKRK